MHGTICCCCCIGLSVVVLCSCGCGNMTVRYTVHNTTSNYHCHQCSPATLEAGPVFDALSNNTFFASRPGRNNILSPKSFAFCGQLHTLQQSRIVVCFLLICSIGYYRHPYGFLDNLLSGILLALPALFPTSGPSLRPHSPIWKTTALNLVPPHFDTVSGISGFCCLP